MHGYVEHVVLAVYLLNPFTIASCVSVSTALPTHLCVALVLYFLVKENTTLSCFFCAMATYFSMYNVVFLAPVVLVRMRRSGVFGVCLVLIGSYFRRF